MLQVGTYLNIVLYSLVKASFNTWLYDWENNMLKYYRIFLSGCLDLAAEDVAVLKGLQIIISIMSLFQWVLYSFDLVLLELNITLDKTANTYQIVKGKHNLILLFSYSRNTYQNGLLTKYGPFFTNIAALFRNLEDRIDAIPLPKNSNAVAKPGR